jgi:hypothetical protein
VPQLPFSLVLHRHGLFFSDRMGEAELTLTALTDEKEHSSTVDLHRFRSVIVDDDAAAPAALPAAAEAAVKSPAADAKAIAAPSAASDKPDTATAAAALVSEAAKSEPRFERREEHAATVELVMQWVSLTGD